MGQPDPQTRAENFQREMSLNDYVRAKELSGLNNDFESGQNDLNRAIQNRQIDTTVSENALARQQEANLLNQTQNFQGGENAQERALRQALQEMQLDTTVSENALARQQEANLLNQTQEFQGRENAQERALRELLQGNELAANKDILKAQQDFQRELDDRAQSNYQSAVDRGQLAAQQGEEQFFSDLNSASPELIQYENAIRSGSTPAQQNALKQIRANLNMQGIHGGQASTLTNRATGDMNVELETDLAQKKLADAQARQQARANYLGQKSAAGNAAAYQYR